MKEILEGLRGPVLGMVMVILFLAGTIVVAAFCGSGGPNEFAAAVAPPRKRPPGKRT